MLHYTQEFYFTIVLSQYCLNNAADLILWIYDLSPICRGDDTRGCGDTIGPPDDEQRAARNMLRYWEY